MGGYNSEKRARLHAKRTTDTMPAIDIRQVHRLTKLTAGLDGNMSWPRLNNCPEVVSIHIESTYIQFTYLRNTGKGTAKEINNVVSLDRTECHYGGERPWFLCPECVSRVAIIYLGEKGFACRSCNELTYESQTLSPMNRLIRKAQKFREGLGGSGNLFEPFPEKPPGMHWRTYHEYFKQATEVERQAWGKVAAGLPHRRAKDRAAKSHTDAISTRPPAEHIKEPLT